jgi:heat shock protein HtpX
MNANDYRNNILKHKITNLLHSAALLGGMAFLLGLLGWIFAGLSGVSWAIILTLASLMITPHLSPRILLRWYGARPVPPHAAPQLYSVLRQLAKRGGLSGMPVLYRVPTRMLNAFAAGSRSHAAIAVTDGLLSTLSTRELTGVIAHELGHLKNSDLWIMNLSVTISRITSFLSLVGQCLLFLNLPLLLASGHHVPWTVILVLLLAPTAAALLQMALSRSREFDADLEAAALTGDPAGLASALSKMERHQQGWRARWLVPGRREPLPPVLRTHPQTRERIQRLLALSAGRRPCRQDGLSGEGWAPDVPAPPAGFQPHPEWHCN